MDGGEKKLSCFSALFRRRERGWERIKKLDESLLSETEEASATPNNFAITMNTFSVWNFGQEKLSETLNLFTNFAIDSEFSACTT